AHQGVVEEAVGILVDADDLPGNAVGLHGVPQAHALEAAADALTDDQLVQAGLEVTALHHVHVGPDLPPLGTRGEEADGAPLILPGDAIDDRDEGGRHDRFTLGIVPDTGFVDDLVVRRPVQRAVQRAARTAGYHPDPVGTIRVERELLDTAAQCQHGD